MSAAIYSKNFIKDLPEGEEVGMDESLLSLQFRCRKGSLWEKHFRLWMRVMKGEIDLDEYYNEFESMIVGAEQ